MGTPGAGVGMHLGTARSSVFPGLCGSCGRSAVPAQSCVLGRLPRAGVRRPPSSSGTASTFILQLQTARQPAASAWACYLDPDCSVQGTQGAWGAEDRGPGTRACGDRRAPLARML